MKGNDLFESIQTKLDLESMAIIGLLLQYNGISSRPTTTSTATINTTSTTTFTPATTYVTNSYSYYFSY